MHQYILIDAVGTTEKDFATAVARSAGDHTDGFIVASFPIRSDGKPMGPIAWLMWGWWAHRKQWKKREA